MRTALLVAVLVVLGPLAPASAARLVRSISTERVDLYQGDPHVVHLDNATFHGALLHQPHAWAMEFYKDWCGHCQRFAPIWSEVARRTKDWGRVVKVGAINCARPRNNAICRQYGIFGVPTVKLFAPGATRSTPGVTSTHHDPDRMVEAIVTFVTSVQRNQRPARWPDMAPFDGSLQQLVQNPEPVQALILESASSSVGRAVQLDLSSHQNHVRVMRATRLPAGLEEPTSERPAMVVFSGGRSQTVTADRGRDPRAVFSNALWRFIGVNGGMRPTQARPRPTAAAPTAATAAPPPVDAGVYMVDMENSLVSALRQEVAGHASVEGERMAALREFLAALVDHFPGRPPLLAALQKLLTFVSRRDAVSGEQVERFLRGLQPPLPQRQPYQACRGSAPQYRGYSCGLWTLFHTLTVQALRNERQGEPISVLPAIHGYVKYFFSCRHCSQHFQQMAAEDGLFNVTTAREAVMWLWRAHNKVNKRIAGDITEDPLHPKVQFPTAALCPYCVVNGKHDEKNVLRFLMDFYGRENIRPDGLQPVPPGAGESTSTASQSPAAAAVPGQSIGARPGVYPVRVSPGPAERPAAGRRPATTGTTGTTGTRRVYWTRPIAVWQPAGAQAPQNLPSGARGPYVVHSRPVLVAPGVPLARQGEAGTQSHFVSRMVPFWFNQFGAPLQGGAPGYFRVYQYPANL